MKNIKYIITCLVVFSILNSCDQGIDSITQVDPGVDATAPQIKINSPSEGLSIKVNGILGSVDIDFEVTDDIEIASVAVMMDGSQIAGYDTFIDYRRFLLDDLTYDQLADGKHVLTVTATDLEGKTTSTSVNFEKEPAYVPKYANEILYIGFDRDYTDLISFEKPTVVGTPSFSDDTVSGSASYAGAADSYLTLSPDRFKNAEFSAIFWMKVNASPGRAGILTLRPPMTDGTHDLTKGFSFFRENADGNQRFKLNVGSGASGDWFDGGTAADVSPNTDEWVNFAFTISSSEVKVYIDGHVVKEGALTGVDWTGCNVLSIMSGAPNFTQWDHWSDESLMDELRIFDRAITQEEIQKIMEDDSGALVSAYLPTFNGEMFYMPFDDSYNELFRDTEATVVGTPSYAGQSAKGSNAYAGNTDSYLTFPIAEKEAITTTEFSATMWYKVNNDPDRAGILTMRPPMTDGKHDLTKGFSFFRENGDNGNQRFKLNVGMGETDQWVDGGTDADVDPTTNEWIHLAFTIATDKAIVYIDGQAVKESVLALPINWDGVNILSIMSGAPNFTEWNHGADLSYMDELRLYNKALSQAEIQATMNY